MVDFKTNFQKKKNSEEIHKRCSWTKEFLKKEISERIFKSISEGVCRGKFKEICRGTFDFDKELLKAFYF